MIQKKLLILISLFALVLGVAGFLCFPPAAEEPAEDEAAISPVRPFLVADTTVSGESNTNSKDPKTLRQAPDEGRATSFWDEPDNSEDDSDSADDTELVETVAPPGHALPVAAINTAQSVVSNMDMEEVRESLETLNSDARANVASFSMSSGQAHVKILPDVLIKSHKMKQIENLIDEIQEISSLRQITVHNYAISPNLNRLARSMQSYLLSKYGEKGTVVRFENKQAKAENEIAGENAASFDIDLALTDTPR